MLRCSTRSLAPYRGVRYAHGPASGVGGPASGVVSPSGGASTGSDEPQPTTRSASASRSHMSTSCGFDTPRPGRGSEQRLEVDAGAERDAEPEAAAEVGAF